MTLTPKNWKSFQHYKDREPAWIKLHKGLLDDFAFSRLPVASRALAPLLWLLASEYESGDITCSFEEIAYRLRMPESEFVDSLKPLIDAGFFILASTMLAEPEQDACLEKDTYTRKEVEGEKDSRSVADATRPPAKFEEFWKAYPRREGPNPRKPAEARFCALVKTGLDPDFLIAEVRKFANRDDTRKQIGTRFIPQAVTWLNQQRWSDHAAVAFLAGGEQQQITVEQAVAQYARIRVWPRGGPVNDVSQVPTDLLAKYGLAPDGRKLEAIQ